MSKQANRGLGITRETRMPLRRMQRAHLATLATSEGQAFQGQAAGCHSAGEGAGPQRAQVSMIPQDRQTGSGARGRGKRRHRQHLRRRRLPRADRDVDWAGLSNLRRHPGASQF